MSIKAKNSIYNTSNRLNSLNQISSLYYHININIISLTPFHTDDVK